MHRVHTKTCFHWKLLEDFSSVFCKIVNFDFSKPKLKLTKTKNRTTRRDPAIWNDFVEDRLKSIEKTPFFKVNMKCKLLNSDNEISYF